MFVYLEGVRLGMGTCPHQVVVGVGGVDFVEAMGVANLANKFGIRVHSLEGQVVLLAHRGWLRLKAMCINKQLTFFVYNEKNVNKQLTVFVYKQFTCDK